MRRGNRDEGREVEEVSESGLGRDRVRPLPRSHVSSTLKSPSGR